MATVEHTGYNTVLKLAEGSAAKKALVGVTSDSFARQANVKTSITKTDAGSKRVKSTSIDDTFTVSGVCGYDSTLISRFDIMQLVGKTVAFEYVITEATAGGGGTVSGDALVTGYSEDTPADPETDPTYSLNLQVTGTPTFTAAS
jgi:hypothetical protein